MTGELLIAEHFYSIQGEGSTAGTPAVFLRLGQCNLLCGGGRTVADLGLHNGATWRCDTIEVWSKGKLFPTHDLLAVFVQELYVEYLTRGAHLVITGGEPLLQQKSLIPFLQLLHQEFPLPLLFTEVETNGTVPPEEEFLKLVTQLNCSPKLSNAGVPKKKRYKPEVLASIAANSSIFKFVVTSEDDVQEIIAEFVRPFRLSSSRVWLMPGASSREDLRVLSGLVVELCKEHGFNFSPRLHVEIWDKAVGV